MSAEIAALSRRVVAAYEAATPASRAFFERARAVLPGGVSGNLRHFKPYPLYTRAAAGAQITDLDGRDVLDCFLCNGPMLLGHRDARIEEAIAQAQGFGSLALNPALLVDCAERVCAMSPCAEQVRFLNSGTEAVLAALRISRAYTRRSRVLKFFGHYHGQGDQMLVGAGPSRIPLGAGVSSSALQDTVTASYGDLEAVQCVLAKGDIAAVILDPAMHSGGLWGSSRAFLTALREAATAAGSVLIFDEVITGFRLAPGGAQEVFGVTPDLVTYAKALGAGEKIAAVAGRADIMSVVDPLDPDTQRRAFQSGTGNDGSRALAAAAAAMSVYGELGQAGAYLALESRASRLALGLREAFLRHGASCHVNHIGSMLQLFLSSEKPSFARYSALDQTLIDLFYLALISRGVMLSLPTSNHIYLSFCHKDSDIDRILSVSDEVLDHFDFSAAFAAANATENGHD